MSSKKIIFCVEGNIGAGKTSALSILEQLFNRTVISEPIDEWKPYLNLFYKNYERWGFTLQIKILLSYFSIYKNVEKISNCVIVERSYKSAVEIFCENLLEQKYINNLEYKTLIEFHDFCETFLENNNFEFIYVLIDTPPLICKERIKKRNRENEQKISMEYIKSLDANITVMKEKKIIHYCIDGKLQPHEIAKEFNDIIEHHMKTENNHFIIILISVLITIILALILV